jgi:uncharacterized protein DUF3761
MRRFLLAALVAAVAAGAATAGTGSAGTAPPGATARCVDGTYSFSQHHSGTCSHHGGVASWLDGGTAVASAPVEIETPGPSVLVRRRTRTANCTRGVLADRRCSPGAYYGRLTRTVICSSSFRTGSIRNVPQSEKYDVEREYGLASQRYGRSIEIDHIISLELGGSNAIANLFPEPGSGPSSYHVKDRLENRLHGLVCAGSITLAAARRGIATNWRVLYRRVFGTPA